MLYNFEDKLVNNVTVTEIESAGNSILLDSIKNVIGCYTQLNVRLRIAFLKQNVKIVIFSLIFHQSRNLNPC